MCGIVGIVGSHHAAPLLLDGLKRLEYRGYDSAGIATLVNGHIERRRAEGKLISLEQLLQQEPLSGTVGIAHTRWATHGKPTTRNAHPHANDKVAVVHNGIIENYSKLKTELAAKGHVFESDTDTEVVVHLVSDYLQQGFSPSEAAAQALPRLEGAYALGIIFAGHHNLLIGARRGSPLAIGYGEDEMYLGSDALALAPLTNRISYLEEGDWVEINGTQVLVRNEQGQPVDRPIRQTAFSGALIGKGEFRHYMLKEIAEQPAVIGEVIKSLSQPDLGTLHFPPMPVDWAKTSRLTITACGTAYYAAFVAKYWFEQVARLPVEIDVASEFRYRQPPMPKDGVMLVVSQSGETADTLAALHYAKSQQQKVIAVVNVPESSMARAADAVLHTHAGPEIGVASTKAFTTQLTVLALLALEAAVARGTISADSLREKLQALALVPAAISEVLRRDNELQALASHIADARDVLYLGRGTSYPLALEGALKLKEISYIHAEGYAAGEMKHGPIALIDEHVPIIVLAPFDAVLEKTASNVQEAMARGGRIVMFADSQAQQHLSFKPPHVFTMPSIDAFAAPILYAAPMQLLAYHTAVLKGTDVDQPRNLAKSVTVE